MKQIDYFKFLRLFPEIVDIEDSVEVKKVLIEEVKKISKVQKEKTKLLPVSWKNIKISTDELKEKIGYNYTKIMFKQKRIFTVHIIKYKNVHGKRIEILPEIHFQRSGLIAPDHKIFMSKEEIINLKRTILIDNILK